MKTHWIDFKELRNQLDFRQILEHYDVEVGRTKGTQYTCFCPLPDHVGNRNSKSFSAELQRGIFNCFGCGSKGNLLDFAVLMDGGNPDDGADLRATALKLCKAFGIPTDRKEPKVQDEPKRKRPERKPSKPKAQDPPTDDKDEIGDTPDTDIQVNTPLTFELRSLDSAHEYFAACGIDPKTIQNFGLGYCSKGLMSGRVAIPVHDARGNLIGYAGRLVEEENDGDEQSPKYLFPPPRETDGNRFEFHKSEVLYNGHRLDKSSDELFIVEGFRDTWHLWQNGYQNVCAIMGSSFSKMQSDLVLNATSPETRLTFLFDADKAGQRCTQEAFMLLGKHRWTRWIELPDEQDPAQLSNVEFSKRIG